MAGLPLTTSAGRRVLRCAPVLGMLRPAHRCWRGLSSNNGVMAQRTAPAGNWRIGDPAGRLYPCDTFTDGSSVRAPLLSSMATALSTASPKCGRMYALDAADGTLIAISVMTVPSAMTETA